MYIRTSASVGDEDVGVPRPAGAVVAVCSVDAFLLAASVVVEALV